MEIEANQKVGIIGRTGSGKSSLISALFRLRRYDPPTSITIDGINLDTVPRTELRKRMAIIPQTPVLFAASVRENLLPPRDHDGMDGEDDGDGDGNDACADQKKNRRKKHSHSQVDNEPTVSDDQIWEALRKCHIEEKIRTMPQGLSTPLDSHTTLSVGERQLLCFTRAMLKRSKIVVLDEATSSVDDVTAERIHALTLTLPCTVLVVAHRLSAIVRLDRVAVMDRGKVIEWGNPAELMHDPNSHLARMIERSKKSGKDGGGGGQGGNVE